MGQIEMLTPADYDSNESYEVAMKTLEILIREFDKGSPQISMVRIFNEIGAPIHPSDEKEIIQLTQENIECARLSVERYRSTLH